MKKLLIVLSLGVSVFQSQTGWFAKAKNIFGSNVNEQFLQAIDTFDSDQIKTILQQDRLKPVLAQEVKDVSLQKIFFMEPDRLQPTQLVGSDIMVKNDEYFDDKKISLVDLLLDNGAQTKTLFNRESPENIIYRPLIDQQSLAELLGVIFETSYQENDTTVVQQIIRVVTDIVCKDPNIDYEAPEGKRIEGSLQAVVNFFRNHSTVPHPPARRDWWIHCMWPLVPAFLDTITKNNCDPSERLVLMGVLAATVGIRKKVKRARGILSRG